MSSFFDHSKAERQASKKWGRVENSSKTGTLVQHNGSAPCSSELSDQMFVYTTLNAGIGKLVWKNWHRKLQKERLRAFGPLTINPKEFQI